MEQNRQLYFLPLENMEHFGGFHFIFFICISRHKLLFIALYIIIEDSLNTLGVMKNEFSELQVGCQKLNTIWTPMFAICQQGKKFLSVAVQKSC